MDLVEVIRCYLRQDPSNIACLIPGWRACERNVEQGSPHNTSSVFAQFYLSSASSSAVWLRTVRLKPWCPLSSSEIPLSIFLYKITATVFRGLCAVPRQKAWIIVGCVQQWYTNYKEINGIYIRYRKELGFTGEHCFPSDIVLCFRGLGLSIDSPSCPNQQKKYCIYLCCNHVIKSCVLMLCSWKKKVRILLPPSP